MKEEIVRILKSENSLIGQAVAPILLQELKAVAPVFGFATKVDGKGRTIKVPVETVVGNTASWKEEYTAPATNDVEFRNVEIERQYIQSQINVTRELETDSNIDIALMLLKRATKDIATIIARETFLGTGKIKGILNNLT
ncbi:MAG: phage major capsid protein, partial [Cetobacterium sp.]